MSQDMIDIKAVFLRETNLAIKVRQDDGTEAWLPKSAIDYDETAMPGEEIDIEVPQDMAEEKRLA